MRLMKYVFHFVLPAALLFILAFVVGTQPSELFGMLGFVAFFTVAVYLLIEGKKKIFSNEKNEVKDKSEKNG